MKISAALGIVILIALAACKLERPALWLAGMSGTAFPLLPRNLNPTEDTRAILPLNGQRLYILANDGTTARATVTKVEMEPDQCMNATSLVFDDKGPDSAFFLASSDPIDTAHSEEMRVDEPGLQFGLVDYLRGRGIANPVIRITRALRVDLNGEMPIIIVAEQSVPRGLDLAEPGEFSIVAVGSYEFGSFRILDAIGLVVPDSEEMAIPTHVGLLGFPDFDGDGKYDIAIWEAGYEWMAVNIHSFANDGLHEESTAWCGS